jgi:acetyl-CoA acetyltransferase
MISMALTGAYSLMDNAYFPEYGGSREDIAHIAVKTNANAVANDLAQFQRSIDVEDVLKIPTVSIRSASMAARRWATAGAPPSR